MVETLGWKIFLTVLGIGCVLPWNLLCVHKGFASELGQPEDSEEEEKEGDFQMNSFWAHRNMFSNCLLKSFIF